MVCKFFDKKLDSCIKNEMKSDQQLAEELHKPIIRKFKKSTITFHRQYMGCRSS